MRSELSSSDSRFAHSFTSLCRRYRFAKKPSLDGAAQAILASCLKVFDVPTA